MKQKLEQRLGFSSRHWTWRFVCRFSILSMVVASVLGQGTLVVPNGFENVEGNSNAGPLFGGSTPSETQIVFGSQHFSSFPIEGAFITELRFRLDGQYSSSRTGTADLEVRLSTTTQNADFLNEEMALNVGADEIVGLPRSTIPLTETFATQGGPNSFSVIIPLPNKFYYNPNNGNLLIDAYVYGTANLANLDWRGVPGDGASAAVRPLSPGTVVVSANAPVTQIVFEPVPEPSLVALLVVGFGALFLNRRMK